MIRDALRLVVSLSLLAVAHPANAAHQNSIVRQHAGQWRLTFEIDSFSGRTACSLNARHLSFERGALLVHLPRRVDTMNAVYRLDGGPPIIAASDEPRLARMGFSLRLDNLNNPSGGLVRIPLDRIGGASRLEVKALPQHRIWSYPLTDLRSAVALFQSAGCS
jgi:hypothetical protein